MRPRIELVMWPVVSAASVALVWALPAAIRFMPHAPSAFWAMAVAELLIGGRRRYYGELGSGLTMREILEGMLLVVVWVAVPFGVLLLARAVMLPGGLREAAVEIRPDFLRTAASVQVGGALLTTITGWWPVLAVLPMFVWHWLMRTRLVEERRLSREPASGLLNRQGLMLGLTSMTAQDLVTPKSPRPYGVVLVSVPSVLAINENLGRDLSEQAVRRAAHRLVEVYGPERVGQVSGESIVILVPDLTEADAAGNAEAAVDVLRPEVGSRTSRCCSIRSRA